MNTKVLINSKTSGKFSREIIDGRSHIITTIMPIRGDIAMNGINYPDKNVEDSFMQLNMLPAPNGHPTVNGVNVSAFHPVANNKHNIGGFMRNPRKKGKRVFVDFLLDEEIANNSDGGKETIRRIESGEKIGVSTGLGITSVINKTGSDDFGKKYTREGSGFKFDHVAILLNEEAAGNHAGTELILNEADGEVLVYNAAESFLDVSESEKIDQLKSIIPNSDNYDIMSIDGVITVNQKPTTNQEVNNMDKNKLVLAIIGNSANKYQVTDVEALNAKTDEELLSIVATNTLDEESAKTLLTNSGHDFDGYKTFVEHKVEFESFLNAEAEATKSIVDNIVANSEYTPEMLDGKSTAELELLTNMLTPEKIALRAGLTTNSQKTTAEKSVVNYEQ